jgi:hypothetical protein
MGSVRMHKLLIDMFSHFVRKDARNWDEYVPYAVMAYRAMPHCSTKYSPYYLVYGRDMRLPAEDDWKPRIGNKELEGDEYEGHVKALSERLREANKAAGQQSKLSHDTVKRYYDRQAKWEQFTEGDYVYIHDPTYKHGKARKFSYQYKGPFDSDQRISPLIYKVRFLDGTSTIVHVSRLKRALKQSEASTTPLTQPKRNKKMTTDQTKENDPEVYRTSIDTEELDIGIPSSLQAIDVGSETLSESEGEISSSQQRLGEDSEWTPGSYLQRKLQGDNETDGIAYQLRSRLVSRSEQDMERDSMGIETVCSPGSKHTQSKMSPSTVKTASSHSYNLRNRVKPVTETKLGDYLMYMYYKVTYIHRIR